MAILQQLLAHAVIFTLALGGMACLCPADAAGTAAAAVHAEHGHSIARTVDEDTDAGCGHEQCGPDCVLVSAVSAKSKPMKSTAPGKNTPPLDDVEFLPVGFADWPDASRQPARSVFRLSALIRPQDSPVRRFDRLLD